MVNASHTFHAADYSIFAVTIVVSLGIGLYYALSGGRQRTTSEYLVGNRRMMIIPVALSLMVSFESSIMMLGIPAEIYVYGLQWLIGNFGFFIANMLAIFVVVPLMHPLRITSAYEYLEMRFKSRAVRVMGTVFGILSYAAYMGIVLFGPAIALEAVTGFPQWASIVAVAGAAVIYTAIGGLKAVIWTDVFQCAVMFAGFFAVLIKGTIRIGGIGKTWRIAAENGRVNFFNFDTDPTVRHTFWNLFIGSIIRGFGLIFNQSSVQRISSTPTVSAATKVLLFTAPAFFLSLCLAGIEGVIAYAYYDNIGCDPIASKQISNPNQVIPYMVMEIFEGAPGMPGLFMASLFSASLSTLSSGLSSLSALTWADLVKPHVKPMSEFRATVIAKLSVVFFGAMAIGIAFGIAHVGGTLIQITGSVLSAISGPLTGLFMLGAFIPWANSKGALVGTLTSATFTFVIAIGQMSTKGAVKNTKLPSGPMDNCPAVNTTLVSEFIMNTTLMSTIGLDTNMSLTGTAINASNAVGDIAKNLTSGWGMGMDVTPSVTGIAVGGMMGSTAVADVVETVSEPTGFRRLYMLSYQWFGTVGILGTIIIGSIVSLITGRSKPGDVDPRYLIPFYDKFFCCLPNSILQCLRCGVDYSKKPLMNGNSTDYLNIDDYEITIAEPKLALELNSKTVTTADRIAHPSASEPYIRHSFDDLLLPKLKLPDKEYEIIDLRNSARTGPLRSQETHIIIDRTVNSVIKLRAKSIEIDVPPKIPSINVIPAEPADDEPIHNDASKHLFQDGSLQNSVDVVIDCNSPGFGNSVGNKSNDTSTATTTEADQDETHAQLNSDSTDENDKGSIVENTDLENIHTIDLDETHEQTNA